MSIKRFLSPSPNSLGDLFSVILQTKIYLWKEMGNFILVRNSNEP